MFFRRAQDRSHNFGESALVLHADDKRIAFKNREASRIFFGKQAIRLELLASQAHDQRRCSEIWMCANVAQRANWNLHARGFQRDPTPISVGYGNHIVHIWESWK